MISLVSYFSLGASPKSVSGSLTSKSTTSFLTMGVSCKPAFIRPMVGQCAVKALLVIPFPRWSSLYWQFAGFCPLLGFRLLHPTCLDFTSTVPSCSLVTRSHVLFGHTSCSSYFIVQLFHVPMGHPAWSVLACSTMCLYPATFVRLYHYNLITTAVP